MRTADNQAVPSKTGEMLTPANKNALWARNRPARFGGGGGSVQRVSRPKCNPLKAPNVVLRSRIHLMFAALIRTSL